MLKLSIQCTRFHSSCTGRSSENICSSSGGAQERDQIKLSLPPKLLEKLVWFRLFCCVKFSFSVTCLMPYYAETDWRRPLIVERTLQMTLICPRNEPGRTNKEGRGGMKTASHYAWMLCISFLSYLSFLGYHLFVKENSIMAHYLTLHHLECPTLATGIIHFQ